MLRTLKKRSRKAGIPSKPVGHWEMHFDGAVAVGAAAGLGVGLASTRYLESLLYQVKVTDSSMIANPCVAIGLVAMVAVTPTVVRALRINPVDLLRSE